MNAQWLRDFNSQETRANIRSERRSWVHAPTTTQWRNNMMPLKRATSLFNAIRYKYDWHFETPDEGAFTLWLDGTSESKRDFVIALNSTLTDSSGYYLVFGERGVEVVRPDKRAPSSFLGESSVRSVAGLDVYSKARSLQRSGVVCITLVYEYGELHVFEGDNPNEPGETLVHFRDERVFAGVHQFGFGMVGRDEHSTDQVFLKHLQKYRRHRE